MLNLKSFKQFLIEEITPFAVFVVARDSQGRVAATTRAADRGESGKIGLPGGKVDPGENPKDAAQRESHEEGWDITVGDVIHKALVDGNMVWWYSGQNPKQLSSYKEKNRIKNVWSNIDQISKSGYGNDFLKNESSNLFEAGSAAERQENSFIAAVEKALKDNNGKPITISSQEDTIKNVTGAKKYTDRSGSGSEPYTDIVIKTTDGVVNVSMKGPSAPSLAGGGLSGIEEIIPGIGNRFFKAAYKNHIDSGLKAGQKVPDTFGLLSDKDKQKLVIGTAAMGGPIDYMYIGPMDVKATNISTGEIKVNGDMISAKVYAKENPLFFRLRARRDDQTFDPDAKDKDGIPKIYGKSSSKGDSAGRLVVTDKPSSTRNIIEF